MVTLRKERIAAACRSPGARPSLREDRLQPCQTRLQRESPWLHWPSFGQPDPLSQRDRVFQPRVARLCELPWVTRAWCGPSHYPEGVASISMPDAFIAPADGRNPFGVDQDPKGHTSDPG